MCRDYIFMLPYHYQNIHHIGILIKHESYVHMAEKQFEIVFCITATSKTIYYLNLYTDICYKYVYTKSTTGHIRKIKLIS